MILKALIIAIALSVDSLAVSLGGSVSLGKLDKKKICSVSLILATVQTMLLCGGYIAGESISVIVSKWGPWIGFLLLLYVGSSMLIEAIRSQGEEARDFGSIIKIFIAAFATSIDAMACGGSFGLTAMPRIELLVLAALTFLATTVFSSAGMVCGHAIGSKFGKPAKIIAGLVLIGIGVEVLLPFFN